MSGLKQAPSSPWFPPEVLKSFHKIRNALSRGRYSQVDYLSQKYQRNFPAYKGYYQENEALAHKRRGRNKKSLELLRAANDFFQGQSLPTLANLIKEMIENEMEEAEKYIQEGLRHFPEDYIVQTLQARLFMKQGYFSKAINCLEQICENGGNEQYLLGECYFRLGMYEKAVSQLDRCHEIEPLSQLPWYNHIFFNHYMPQYTQEDLLTCIQNWYKAVCEPFPVTPPQLLKRKLKTNKKIRIGLFSSGFKQHPVGWMTAKVFRWLSFLPDYEFFFYCIEIEDINKHDSLRQIFKSASSKWVDIQELDYNILYKKVINDKLDLAIDLCGHGEGCVLPLFSARIAPIQIKWVGGLFNTTGVPAMDYLLTDRYQTPDGCDNNYTEKLVRLPNSYVSYSLVDYGEPSRIKTEESQSFCFGCFNNAFKLNPVIGEVWSRILKKVPGSILFLKDTSLDSLEIRDYVLSLFTRYGIEKERIHIEGPSLHAELMKCYNRVDIALDPWPYTGGLTTLEALWMGVPVITTPGPSFAGRHATSHLCNVGLQMLVTEDFDHYVDLAVKLANNPSLLDQLRTLIPYSVANSALVRHEQLAADLNTAFHTMWERHCQGLSPIAIRFEQQSQLPEAFLPFFKEKKI